MKKAKEIISNTGKLLLVFGILFSQMSFPLSVLADEISSDEINPVEIDTDDEEKETETNEEDKDTEEESPIETSIIVELKDNKCIIKGKKNTPITNKELEDALDNLEGVKDLEGNEVEEEEQLIYSGYQVITLNEDTTTSTYQVVIIGDYNNNGYLDEEDSQKMLELLKENPLKEELTEKMPIIDVNEDNQFNILDVTHPIFYDGTWENNTNPTDSLTGKLFIVKNEENVEEVSIDEEFEVKYYVRGFDADSLKGIEGKINYDKDLLELTSVKLNKELEIVSMELDSEETDFSEEKFAYLLNDYNMDGILLTFKFKSISSGNATISLEDMIASVDGMEANLNNDLATTDLTILEYGKGGDIEEPEENNNTTNNNVVSTSKETSTPIKEQQTNIVQYVSLSSDNYIKNLTIKGYEIDFNMYNYEYSIKVKNSVKSLNLDIVLNDENASYVVEGNKDFKVGENTVNIKVTAEDGSTRNYTIKVNKEKSSTTNSDDEEEQTTSNASKTVIVILIILVIIGLIYVIFKDDEEDRKESKK